MVTVILLFAVFIFCFSHNNLSRCPLRIGFLGSQLVSLDLSSNSLSDLPEEIGCLLGLERLLLGGNKLKNLPVSTVILQLMRSYC